MPVSRSDRGRATSQHAKHKAGPSKHSSSVSAKKSSSSATAAFEVVVPTSPHPKHKAGSSKRSAAPTPAAPTTKKPGSSSSSAVEVVLPASQQSQLARNSGDNNAGPARVVKPIGGSLWKLDTYAQIVLSKLFISRVPKPHTETDGNEDAAESSRTQDSVHEQRQNSIEWADISAADVLEGQSTLKYLEDNAFFWTAVKNPETIPEPIQQRLFLVLLGSYLIQLFHPRDPEKPLFSDKDTCDMMPSVVSVLEHRLDVPPDCVSAYLALVIECRTQLYISRSLDMEETERVQKFMMPLESTARAIELHHLREFEHMLQQRADDIQNNTMTVTTESGSLEDFYPFDKFYDDASMLVGVFSLHLENQYPPDRVRELVQKAAKVESTPTWYLYREEPRPLSLSSRVEREVQQTDSIRSSSKSNKNGSAATATESGVRHENMVVRHSRNQVRSETAHDDQSRPSKRRKQITSSPASSDATVIAAPPSLPAQVAVSVGPKKPIKKRSLNLMREWIKQMMGDERPEEVQQPEQTEPQEMPAAEADQPQVLVPESQASNTAANDEPVGVTASSSVDAEQPIDKTAAAYAELAELSDELQRICHRRNEIFTRMQHLTAIVSRSDPVSVDNGVLENSSQVADMPSSSTDAQPYRDVTWHASSTQPHRAQDATDMPRLRSRSVSVNESTSIPLGLEFEDTVSNDMRVDDTQIDTTDAIQSADIFVDASEDVEVLGFPIEPSQNIDSVVGESAASLSDRDDRDDEDSSSVSGSEQSEESEKEENDDDDDESDNDDENEEGDANEKEDNEEEEEDVVPAGTPKTRRISRIPGSNDSMSQTKRSNSKYSRWTQEEDNALVMALKKHGARWTEITRTYASEGGKLASRQRHNIRHRSITLKKQWRRLGRDISVFADVPDK